MSTKLVIVLPETLFEQLASAARLACQPVSTFAKEVLEADIAGRRLASLPPSLEPDRRVAERMRAYRARLRSESV